MAEVVLVESVIGEGSTGAEEVAQWYRTQYAPLWQSVKTADPNVLTRFFRNEGFSHADGGEISVWRGPDWSRDYVNAVVNSGWVGGELLSVEAELINSSTASLKVRWSNQYADGVQRRRCEWYLVDRLQRRWAITNHGDWDCPGGFLSQIDKKPL